MTERRIRVLVVDDSVTVRRTVSEALSQDPALQVVGTAANGQEALELLRPLRPDIVILDIEMPVLDGIETLTRLKAIDAGLPVIVFSASGPHAPARTLQALWLGASDYVTKPAANGMRAAIERVREELVWRIKAIVPERDGTMPARPEPAAGREDPAAPPAAVVVVGASTGGPRALGVLLGRLPKDLAAPIVVVQHLPATFTDHFVAGLARGTLLTVRIAEHGETLAPGTVWIAPGDRHVEVARRGARLVLRLHDGPAENACRPSVDPLFRSAAEVVGAQALGVVLTGMGRDGLTGCRRLRAVGGGVIAQDESTSVIWGMPGAVVRAGLASAVLPLDHIGDEIVQRTRRPGRAQRPHAA